MQVIRFIRDANGARIAYATVGEGRLILCPAWWVSHVERDWEHPGFRRFFGRLAEGFRVVRYDRPGTGLSDRDVPPRTQADEVQLLATLADELGDSQFSLFAVSCAGPVALTYAAAHQERVRRLCFYGSYARGADIATPDLRDAITDLVSAHWGLGSVALTALFLPGASIQDSENFSRNQQDWANAPQAAQLLRLSCEMNVAADVLSRVQAEALVIHRRKDRAIPLEAGQKLAAELPRARLITLDGDIHLPWIDGDAIADAVHSFLAGDEVRAAASAPLSGCRLDEANREIVLDGQRRPTTRLEYAVILTLIQASGRVITRDEMLAEIWNTPFAGSNKVDAVVGSLRKKLGPFAASIETVTGHGYRFRGWKKAINDVH
ncbi:alpha/beta fold hydrolase [Bradyrhizobium sp. AZCC 1678]|uniref:alpha/beta fold hydrolase n=1 Tax=Bradyrhizobium sp. AZCC 1678 TaxID=3117030 RepID=UPI002FF155DA